MVYVDPARDMAVRPGQHVSTEGRVYHPYLAQWAGYWEVSTMTQAATALSTKSNWEPS